MSIDAIAMTRLRSWVAEERKKSLEQLISGAGIEDMRKYGYACGYVKALDDTLTVLTQIIEDIQGG